MNPHDELLHETLKVLGNKNWVEISYVNPFGFREVSYPTRINVSITEFLEDSVAIDTNIYDTCVLHILLGCGVKFDILEKVINKCLDTFSSVVVLEHDKTSSDWSNDSLRREHSIDNCLSGEELLKVADKNNWNCSDILYMANNRNLIVELSR